MKLNTYLIGLFCMACASCNNDENHLLCYDNHQVIEGDITLAGAVGDGETDCSAIINELINKLPAEGGTIVIPEGDFVLDQPIVVSKNNVTIKGLNPGFRSNIDVKDPTLFGPGGGSKLIVRNAAAAISVGSEGVSNLIVKDLLISGGTQNNGIGIHLDKATTGAKIQNIIGINLITGIQTAKAKKLTISDCWICELSNSMICSEGEETLVENCQLGAQPSGVTCRFTDEKKLLFRKNQVYPDGVNNLVLDNCEESEVYSNNFKSYYIGIVEVSGHKNHIYNNIIWLTGAIDGQFMGKNTNHGVVRVSGNDNLFEQNTITCEWSGAGSQAVTVNATSGTGNRFVNCLISNTGSDCVFLINQYTTVSQCVSADKVKVQMEEPSIEPLTESVALLVAAESEEAVTDDDELAALTWFKSNCPNGRVLTTSSLSAEALAAYKVVWVAIDRVGIGHGIDRLPLDNEAIALLADYYRNGGNLLLSNHATQLIVAMGRTERMPGIFGDGNGGSGTDYWVINANIGVGIADRGEGYDHRSHPIYEGLWVASPYGFETFPMIGPGQREDHNCMWDLNAYGFPDLYPEAGHVVNAFQQENQATVLATWGHVQDWCCAGLVEFHPTDKFKGTCLAMGLAAYEWNQNSGYNDYQYNIKRITRNMLSYLSKQ